MIKVDKNTQMNPSQVETEFAKWLCINFLMRSFKEKGTKYNITICYSIVEKLIIDLARLNSLKNKKPSPLPANLASKLKLHIIFNFQKSKCEIYGHQRVKDWD